MVTLLAAAGVLLAAPAAHGQGVLTATGIRIGNHPAFVRVVVDFEGARLRDNQVLAADPSPFDGRARVRVSGRGIDADADPERAHGVSARVVQRDDAVVLRLRADERRFKYLGYLVLHGPERLAVDLWKARPPRPAAEFLRAPQGGCLTLGGYAVRPGFARAHGTEQGIFEHMFQLALRRAGGGVVRAVGVTSSAGEWRRRLRYSVGRRQAGTLEAVDLSEKDGSLACIVQVAVILRPAP